MAEMPEYQIDGSKIYRATIELDDGTIVMDLDPQLAPNTVNNFVGLARQGYYDGLTFHRVVPEFVVQGGCPEGSGRGGPGYKFADEPVKGDYTLGAVAMANAGPNTNGSQFFITIDDCQKKLSKDYNSQSDEISSAFKNIDFSNPQKAQQQLATAYRALTPKFKKAYADGLIAQWVKENVEPDLQQITVDSWDLTKVPKSTPKS